MMMSRYLKLYTAFLKINLKRELQYRAHFFLDNLITIIWSCLLVLYYIFIYRYTAAVRGWRLEQVLVLTGFYLVFNSIFKSLIEQNFAQFTRIIYRGELDYILVKPVNSQFLISLSRFSLRSFLRLFGGLAILIWGIVAAKLKISVLIIFLSLGMFAIGQIIVYSLWFMSLLLAFRLGNIENLYYFFMSIFQTTRLPINLYPHIGELIFTFVLPLIFVATIPAQALWQPISGLIIIYGIVVAVVLLWLSHYLWQLALRSYTSASS